LGYFRNRFPKVPIIPISAMEGEGLDELKTEISKILDSRDE
jgi:selenocysteine-specific translation elongation factor